MRYKQLLRGKLLYLTAKNCHTPNLLTKRLIQEKYAFDAKAFVPRCLYKSSKLPPENHRQSLDVLVLRFCARFNGKPCPTAQSIRVAKTKTNLMWVAFYPGSVVSRDPGGLVKLIPPFCVNCLHAVFHPLYRVPQRLYLASYC